MSNFAEAASGLPPIGYRAVRDDYPRADPKTGRDTDLPEIWQDDSQSYVEATEYLDTVLPGLQVEPLSNKGTTAVVMHDDRYAYKVIRTQQHGYTRVEDEVVALRVMAADDVTVRPVALLDAALEHRYVTGYSMRRERLFDGKVTIPFIAGTGRLPVIVTELRELEPISELPAEILVREFRLIAGAMRRHDLMVTDGEFMYDPRASRAVAIDLGHASHPIVSEAAPEGYDSDADPLNIREAMLVHDAFVRFCPRHTNKPDVMDIAGHLAAGGIASLDGLLHEHVRATS